MTSGAAVPGAITIESGTVTFRAIHAPDNLTRIETASNKRCHALAKQRAGTHIGFDGALLIRLEHCKSTCRITQVVAGGADTNSHIFAATPAEAAKAQDCLLIHSRGGRRQAQHWFHGWG